MDLESSELSVVESLQDNGEIETKVQNTDGSYLVENNVILFSSKFNENGTSVSLLPLKMKHELLRSPSETKRGRGLRKWRRIKRDVSKVGESGVDSDRRELSASSVSSSKRVKEYADRNEKSEGSASSTNAVVRTFDGFSLVRDLETSFADDTDSENSEDQSSKSSTAASVPKVKQKMLIGVFSHDKSTGTSHEKNLTHSIHNSQQGNGRSDSKRARGGMIKIEKENSHSSVESDLRSSNFVFVQGSCSTSKGMQSERLLDSDGENGDEAQCSEREVSDGVQSGYVRNNVGGYEDTSPDVVAESSWEDKDERSNDHGSTVSGDPLTGSISELQSVQEALSKEVLMFKEIKDVSVDDSISEMKSEVIQEVNGETEKVLEIFKQKFETEVECLVLTKTVQQWPVDTHQLPVSEDPKVVASEQSQVLHELEAFGNKAEKVENIRDVIAITDETLQLQKRVCKYTSCFFVQLVLLTVVLGVFILQSLDYTEVVPT